MTESPTPNPSPLRGRGESDSGWRGDLRGQAMVPGVIFVVKTGFTVDNGGPIVAQSRRSQLGDSKEPTPKVGLLTRNSVFWRWGRAAGAGGHGSFPGGAGEEYP